MARWNRHSSARGRISGICQTMMTSKIEITFPSLPDGGLLGGDGDCQSTASSSPLTRHVLLQFEPIHVAFLSTMSSLQYANRSVRTSLVWYA
jgi:hypothetical protein